VIVDPTASPLPTTPAADGRAGTWTTFVEDDGLPDSETWSLAQGPDGAIWVATSGGLGRWDGQSWTRFELGDENNVGAQVRSIDVADDGTVWAGTFMGGVSGYREGGWTTYRTPIEQDKGPIANDVQVVHVDPRGVLWVGTRAGLSRFDGRAWSHFGPDDGLAGFDVLAIASDSSGAVWVGTRGDFINPNAGGLSRLQAGRWTSVAEADGLPEDYVQAIAVGPGGDVWIGTQGEGVGHFDGETWRVHANADGLPGSDVTAVAVEADGGIWIGTRDAGVARFDGEHWESFSEEDGLASNSVHGILVDRDGRVWLATGNGLSRYQPAGRDESPTATRRSPQARATSGYVWHLQNEPVRTR
jgi:ligand-binding sensor domain-containing protein